MKRSESGVTLIELMVTIAIIAVVASIGVPMYSSYVRSANVAECTSEVSAIEIAQNEFFLENNTYFGAGLDTSADPISDFENASGGLYVSGYTVPANAIATQNNVDNAQCDYAITPGATGDIATSFQITATGKNDLTGAGCIARKPIVCP